MSLLQTTFPKGINKLTTTTTGHILAYFTLIDYGVVHFNVCHGNTMLFLVAMEQTVFTLFPHLNVQKVAIRCDSVCDLSGAFERCTQQRRYLHGILVAI